MDIGPVPSQHDVVMQNQMTGQVDFLQFNGTTLVASLLENYGIAGWMIVANGDFNGDHHHSAKPRNQRGL